MEGVSPLADDVRGKGVHLLGQPEGFLPIGAAGRRQLQRILGNHRRNRAELLVHFLAEGHDGFGFRALVPPANRNVAEHLPGLIHRDVGQQNSELRIFEGLELRHAGCGISWFSQVTRTLLILLQFQNARFQEGVDIRQRAARRGVFLQHVHQRGIHAAQDGHAPSAVCVLPGGHVLRIGHARQLLIGKGQLPLPVAGTGNDRRFLLLLRFQPIEQTHFAPPFEKNAPPASPRRRIWLSS